MAKQFPEVDIAEIMDLLMVEAEIAHAPPLSTPVCSDPEDISSWRVRWPVLPTMLSLEISSS